MKKFFLTCLTLLAIASQTAPAGVPASLSPPVTWNPTCTSGIYNLAKQACLVTSGGSGITSINGDTTAAQLISAASTGSNFTISTSGGTTTIAIPTASASNRGLLSSADWSTFNGKQASGSYITGLTSDVSASGPGSVAATVNSVGGSSAANINTATGLVNGAQSGNKVFSSPSNGSSGAPAFRTLVSADIPSLSATYLPLSGGTMSGQINMGSNKIVSVTDPTSAQDAATKNYVDSVASGLNPLQGVQAATTANIPATYLNGVAGVGATLTITATGAITIDGYAIQLNDRVLFKNQTSGFQNGVYFETLAGSIGVSPVFTRALDYNTATDVNAGDLIPVINGTVNTKTSWLQTATVTTMGTDSLVFTQWSYDPTTLVTLAGTQTITGAKTFSADLAATSTSTTALKVNSTTFVVDATNGAIGVNVAPATSASIDVVNSSASDKPVQMTGYGTGSTVGYRGRFARGTSGSPTATQSGDLLNFLSGRGYGATGFASAATSVFQIIAGENFTDAAMGTYARVMTTPIGSTTSAEVARFNTTGNVLIGTTSDNATDKLQVSGSASATSFSGSGSGLTSLNASNLSSGTVAAARMPAFTGDVTTSAGAVATTIANNAVSNAKFRQGAALSVVGVTGNATANEADIAGTADQVLRLNSAGTALAFGQVNLAASAAVTGVLPNANTTATTAATASTLVLRGTDGNNMSPGVPSAGVVSVNNAASPYTITSTDLLLLVDTSGGAVTIKLPAVSNNRKVRIKDSTGNFGTNNVTLQQNASEKIEGIAASLVLSANWGNYEFTSNNTDWFKTSAASNLASLTWNSSTTWTVPAGVTAGIICGEGGAGGGGGGGGGGGSGVADAGGGGGSSGGVVVMNCLPANVTPNTSMTITIGALGAGGSAGSGQVNGGAAATAGGTGGTGGNSVFGTIYTFFGGNPGNGGGAASGNTAGSAAGTPVTRIIALAAGGIGGTAGNAGVAGGNGSSDFYGNRQTGSAGGAASTGGGGGGGGCPSAGDASAVTGCAAGGAGSLVSVNGNVGSNGFTQTGRGVGGGGGGGGGGSGGSANGGAGGTGSAGATNGQMIFTWQE